MDSSVEYFLFAVFLASALVSVSLVHGDPLNLGCFLQFSPFAGKYVLEDGKVYFGRIQNLLSKDFSFTDFFSFSLNFEGHIMFWASLLGQPLMLCGLMVCWPLFVLLFFVVDALLNLPDVDFEKIGWEEWIASPLTCFLSKVIEKVWNNKTAFKKFLHSIFYYIICLFLNIVVAYFLFKMFSYYLNPGVNAIAMFFLSIFFIVYEFNLFVYAVLYLSHIVFDTLAYGGSQLLYPIPLTLYGSMKPAMIILCATPATFLLKPFFPNLQMNLMQTLYYSLYIALASVFASWLVFTPYLNIKNFLASRKKSSEFVPRTGSRRRRRELDESYTLNITSEEEFLKMFELDPFPTMKGLKHDIVLAEKKNDWKTFDLYSRFYVIRLLRMRDEGLDTRSFEGFVWDHGFGRNIALWNGRSKNSETVYKTSTVKSESKETVQEKMREDEERRRRMFEDLVSLKVFDGVVGLREAKEEIVWKFLVPALYPEKAGGRKPGGGILLYGPPGTGKTELARVLKEVCEENGIKFVHVSPASVNKPYHGQSEAEIAKVFSEARSASNGAIVFIDEADALLGMRGESDPNWSYNELSQFLQEMDGLNTRCEKIFVIACTNKPWNVDPAATRPGRLSKRVYIPPPNYSERKELFKLFLKDKKAGEIDFDRLAYLTSSEAGVYSGADIMQICDEARVLAEKRGSNTITMEDLEEAIEKTAPSIPPKLLDAYEEYESGYSGKKPPTQAPASNKTIYG